MSVGEKIQSNQFGRGAGPVRTRLEQFFARDTGIPLADAFETKGAVHPFVGMSPVPKELWDKVWDNIKTTPRSGNSVAYIHIPFCENHCLFCGFYQNPWRTVAGPDYAATVIREIERDTSLAYQAEGPIHAVYFGGGTPSALAPEQLRQMLEAVHKNLPLAPDCEVTVEGRVFNFTEDKAKACFDGGANRLSIGVQSFKESLRHRMGRKAGRGKVISFLEKMVATDQAAIVIDLIYGFPDQTLENWADDVQTAIATGIHGIDLYSLNLIPSTPLVSAIKKGKFPPPAAARDKGDYYKLGAEILRQARWETISTTHWRHTTRERNLYNLMVKSGANCLSFGSGAGGYLGGYSFRNDGDLRKYVSRIDAGEKPFNFLMKQPDDSAIYNFIKGQMELGRLNITWLAQELGDALWQSTAPLIKQWGQTGLLTIDGDWVDLTLTGRYWQVTLTINLIEWIKLNNDCSMAA
jgi:anaerobilin synthase